MRNLDEALNNSEATQVFTAWFLNAIKQKDFPTIETTNKMFITYSETGMDLLDYDCSALFAARLTTMLSSHNTMLNPLTSPLAQRLYHHPHQPCYQRPLQGPYYHGSKVVWKSQRILHLAP